MFEYLKAFQVGIAAFNGFLRANRPGVQIAYIQLVKYGHPQATILIARDRESWRVSNLAAEVYPHSTRCP